ncbi:MAG: inositol monophosphatase [Alphaproteobacteria bacterium]|nr:inositol monophosphatase [Alphaproteobacteria bacterium]MCK5555388.1 inositol monophosphatase [Alphaproteobacteria bacterium]MCK5658538.1 inositol monophosphatase [Alphaproteobacteria bacterium]
MAARRSAHLNVMIEAIEKAGRALTRDFGEVEQLQVSRKGPGDFVSAADFKSEKILREELLKARPSYGFLFEESGEFKGEDKNFRWIIDPLDGTTNFLHGLPHWSISIALEKNGEIVAAVTNDPIKHELFFAEKGGGAFINSKRLRVSGRISEEDCLMSFGTEKTKEFFSDLGATAPSVGGMRRMGSACLDLAYVAAGRFDVFWCRGLHPWDTAAGSLLIKEAGGFITDMDGGKNYIYGRSILAANQSLHTGFLKKLKQSSTKEPIKGKISH